MGQQPGQQPGKRLVSDEREARLPRWARELLAHERRERRDAERRLAAHLETVVKSSIWYGNYDNPVYVPDPYGFQTVHFVLLDGSDRVGDQISVHIDKGGLQIMGGSSVALEPCGSNSLSVRLRDR